MLTVMSDNVLPVPTRSKVSIGTDTNGRPYPRPIVAVDIALLSVNAAGNRLEVAQMWRADTDAWALPGAFLRQGETLADAVTRCLHDKLGVEGIRLRQLQVFDDPHRDDRGWVLSVAHVAVVRPDRLRSLGAGTASRTRMASVDRPGELAWDHAEIVRLAKNDVRRRYAEYADPDHLLDREFTLRELWIVHQAVAGTPLDRDKFRRSMEDRVEGTGTMRETGTRGRPAEWLRRKK